MAQRGTHKLAVIGHPIKHSLSPRIHTYWIKKYSIDASYEAIEVPPDTLPEFIRSLPEKGFTGINITLPHKETALRLTDENDEAAEAIGAVNTVIVKPGKLLGRNTDAYGFMENLKTSGRDFAGSRALVIGAGGAARAVCKGLLDAGCAITLTNRTRGKADELARAFKNRIKVAGWDELNHAMKEVDLLVNTTSLGMKGQPTLDISLDDLPKDAVVTDIIYNPLITALIAQAKLHRHTTVDGLGMLLYQAQMAFNLWFGIMPEVDDTLRKHVLEA